MSQPAPANVQPSTGAIAGNTARVLPDGGAPQQYPAPQRRTPLSLVPARSGRRRTPFVVFCFLTLAAALVGVLVLNVSLSSGQYKLVDLHNRQVSLAQKNEMLTQRLKTHQAPQNLAAAAAELGMVSSPSFGTIDLETMSLSGNPKPAEETEGPEVRIPAPDVAIQPRLSEPDPASPSETSGEEASSSSDQGTEGSGEGDAQASSEGDAQASADGGQNQANAEGNAAGQSGQDSGTSGREPGGDSAPDNVVPAPAQAEPKELNGGTIPAPQQQTAQQ
ncbi:MAG TPA: hypothetical protein VFM62_06205 [Arthrobacter sp.]|nr:hypothetical protein [Arthrobacter sp.]